MVTAIISTVAAALGGGAIAAIVATVVVAVAVSAIFNAVLAPDEPEQAEEQQPEVNGPLVNKRSNVSSIPVIYGTRRVGGNRIFVATEGTDNKFLHVVLIVCEGEIDGFSKVYLDDSEVRFSGVGTTFNENQSYTAIGAIENNEAGNPENTGLYSGFARFRFHNGSADQGVDGELDSVFSQWTSSHRLRGRAYVYARFEYDQDTFGGIPNIQTDCRGKRVASISGNTINDNNLQYSNNPALCLRDYLINDDYGRGLDPDTIDDEKIIEAANYCDASITLNDGLGGSFTANNRYTMDGLLQTSRTLYTNTQKILTHMRGFLVFSSGLYKLILDKAEISQVLYDESNIIGPINADLGSKKNTLNRIRGTFWNPEKNGDDDSLVIDAPTVRDEKDNGTVLSKDIRLPFCNSSNVARYLLNQELEQSRQQIKVVFNVGLAGLQNDIGDIIRIRHSSFGWGTTSVMVDGEVVTRNNEPLTINNIGKSGIFPDWEAGTTYSVNDIVTFTDAAEVSDVFVALTTTTGDEPDTSQAQWKIVDEFNDIPTVNDFGVFFDLDGDGTNDSNLGLDGNPLYKEFRILGLSMQDQEMVELTCIEYDGTVYDSQPLGLVDATDNTSFQNPNRIPAVDSDTINFQEELYVTSTSGGVKSAIVFNWDSPNTPFVRSYDIYIHRPEQDFDVRDSYVVGGKIAHNNARWIATQDSGPLFRQIATEITVLGKDIEAGELVSVDANSDGVIDFFRAIIAQSGVTTSTNFFNALIWGADDGSGSVEPFVGSAHWTQLTALTDDDFVFQTSARAREFTLLDSKPGAHDIRIQALSVTGTRAPITQKEDIVVLGLTRAPADIEGFGLQIQGTLALLTWTPSTDLDVRIGGSIQVRHAPSVTADTFSDSGFDLDASWSNSAILTEGKSGVTSQILVPLLQGLYMMKSIDASGIESSSPAAILNEAGTEVTLFPITSGNEEPEWLGRTPGGDADTTPGNDSENLELFPTPLPSPIDSDPTITVYDNTFNYEFGDRVSHDNTIGTHIVYEAIVDPGVGQIPDVNPSVWQPSILLRIDTLPVWDSQTPYFAGDQVQHSGDVGNTLYEANKDIAAPAPGQANTTPEGEDISLWGLISQRSTLGSEDWDQPVGGVNGSITAGRKDLTVLDVPQFTTAVYYFNNDIQLADVESQELSSALIFTAFIPSGSMDNLQVPIDDLVQPIDTLGAGDAGTSVRLEISTTSDDPADPLAVWSSYSTFTDGSYNFRGARFRVSVIAALLGTQVAITDAAIISNLPAKIVNNITSPVWEGGFDSVDQILYEVDSGVGSSFHSGGATSISGPSTPDIAIVAENIRPGEYFVVSTDPTNIESGCLLFGGTWSNPGSVNGTCSGTTVLDSDALIAEGFELAAPFAHLGFNIRFKRVQTHIVDLTGGGTATVQGTPADNDDVVDNKDINYDYQATGY